jgi:hypothetical protein
MKKTIFLFSMTVFLLVSLSAERKAPFSLSVGTQSLAGECEGNCGAGGRHAENCAHF